MKANTSKERNFYTQGQQFTARVLFTVWLLTSVSPESTLAIPKRQMVPATTTSPGDPSLASAPPTPPPGGILQLPPGSPGSFWSSGVLATPDQEHDLLRTFPGASPVSENLSFEAREGESVRFYYQMGQWRAEVSSHIGASSRQSVLPVVCSQGEDIASSLEVLSRYPSWQRQRQIHVLDSNVCPTLGAVVYVGALGLKGGGEGEASGSGEQEVSPPSLSRSSLDWLQEQIAARKSPEEVYPLIAERLADPEKIFTRSDQIRLLTDCVRYGRVNAEALSGKDAIVVLGNTGAGKSTFINYLAGCQLEEQRVADHVRALVVKDQSLEVAPIGHGGSKTFMPHIIEVAGRVYCDCPGFSDNRGAEINIANAVNMKQALSHAKSLRLVFLVDYRSLAVDRGHGFQDLIRTLTALLGSQATIIAHQQSILLGISRCPEDDLSLEELWDDYLSKHVPESLSFLKDRLLVFHPLSPKADWDRSGCLEALDGLAKVPNPSSILSVSLNASDQKALHELGASIEQELEAALSRDDAGTASSYFRCLERLLVLEHEEIQRLLSRLRGRTSVWLQAQESRFRRHYVSYAFSEAESLLSCFEEVVRSFGLPTSGLSSLEEELSLARNSYRDLVSRYQHELEAQQARVSTLEGELEQKSLELEAQQAQVSALKGELEQKSLELEGLENALKKAQFGDSVLDATLWERYFGEVGVAPPLPADIEEIMNSPCPFFSTFWKKKQIKETHLLALIPSHVAGKPLTLDYLGELIQSPKGGGHGNKYRNYDEVPKAIRSQSPDSSYWVLMTRDVLPGSRDKSYTAQCALAAFHQGYTVPGALETAVVVSLHHVRSGERLDRAGLSLRATFTRCREKDKDGYPVVVAMASWVLNFVPHNGVLDDYNVGIAGLRKF